VSDRRNAGCGGQSGCRGALGLGDVHGRVVRAGGQQVKRAKKAVAAYSEEGGGIGRTWQLGTGVRIAHD
jgi:hypothetical protein